MLWKKCIFEAFGTIVLLAIFCNCVYIEGYIMIAKLIMRLNIFINSAYLNFMRKFQRIWN